MELIANPNPPPPKAAAPPPAPPAAQPAAAPAGAAAQPAAAPAGAAAQPAAAPAGATNHQAQVRHPQHHGSAWRAGGGRQMLPLGRGVKCGGVLQPLMALSELSHGPCRTAPLCRLCVCCLFPGCT
jgi:hypothetical protein